MPLQYGHRGAGTKAPDANGLVTAARRDQRVLVADRQVRDLRRVSAQRGVESPVERRPDFDQTVVRALMYR